MGQFSPVSLVLYLTRSSSTWKLQIQNYSPERHASHTNPSLSLPLRPSRYRSSSPSQNSPTTKFSSISLLTLHGYVSLQHHVMSFSSLFYLSSFPTPRTSPYPLSTSTVSLSSAAYTHSSASFQPGSYISVYAEEQVVVPPSVSPSRCAPPTPMIPLYCPSVRIVLSLTHAHNTN